MGLGGAGFGGFSPLSGGILHPQSNRDVFCGLLHELLLHGICPFIARMSARPYEVIEETWIEMGCIPDCEL